MVDESEIKFREVLNQKIDGYIQKLYSEIPYAIRLKGDAEISKEYHVRHTIEIILRLRMKRVIDALTIHYFTKKDPKLAKLWCEYTGDEMLHDAWFSKDVVALGVSKEEIYSFEPMFSTKLLQGYFYYCLEHEGGPYASLCSSYFIEYASVKTQPIWLEAIGKQHGDKSVSGSKQHVDLDIDEDHTDFVWGVMKKEFDINLSEDRNKILLYVSNVAKLFLMFYTELYYATVDDGKENSFDSKIRDILVTN